MFEPTIAVEPVEILDAAVQGAVKPSRSTVGCQTMLFPKHRRHRCHGLASQTEPEIKPSWEQFLDTAWHTIYAKFNGENMQNVDEKSGNEQGEDVEPAEGSKHKIAEKAVGHA